MAIRILTEDGAVVGINDTVFLPKNSGVSQYKIMGVDGNVVWFVDNKGEKCHQVVLMLKDKTCYLGYMYSRDGVIDWHRKRIDSNNNKIKNLKKSNEKLQNILDSYK